MGSPEPFQRDIQQTPTCGVDLEDIMATVAFRQGVADVRAGRPPRFDGSTFELMPLERKPPSLQSFTNQLWCYERGRQFGVLAPRDLHVVNPRTKRLNQSALHLYSVYAFVLEDIL